MILEMKIKICISEFLRFMKDEIEEKIVEMFDSLNITETHYIIKISK